MAYPSGDEVGKHIMGNDPKPEPLARNMSLYHLALRIKDPERSLQFYRDILGMRIIFMMNCGSFSIYYIGCSDEETTEQAMGNIFDRRGMIELLHVHGTEKDPDFEYIAKADTPHQGFAHLGYCVDNLPEVTARLEKKGVKVVKPQGMSGVKTIGFPENTPEAVKEWVDLFKHMVVIQDPDGYWIELVPRNLHDLLGI